MPEGRGLQVRFPISLAAGHVLEEPEGVGHFLVEFGQQGFAMAMEPPLLVSLDAACFFF